MHNSHGTKLLEVDPSIPKEEEKGCVVLMLGPA